MKYQNPRLSTPTFSCAVVPVSRRDLPQIVTLESREEKVNSATSLTGIGPEVMSSAKNLPQHVSIPEVERRLRVAPSPPELSQHCRFFDTHSSCLSETRLSFSRFKVENTTSLKLSGEKVITNCFVHKHLHSAPENHRQHLAETDGLQLQTSILSGNIKRSIKTTFIECEKIPQL